jgi:hypothetical protein
MVQAWQALCGMWAPTLLQLHICKAREARWGRLMLKARLSNSCVVVVLSMTTIHARLFVHSLVVLCSCMQAWRKAATESREAGEAAAASTTDFMLDLSLGFAID